MRFVSCGTTVNYGQVNEILKKSIEKHIPKGGGDSNLSISFFIRQKADIFMSHGCADKNYRCMLKCKYLKHFKYILVPGPWLKNKLIRLGVPKEKLFCVGWPKIDLFFANRKKYLNDKKAMYQARVTKTRGRSRKPKVKILWAPSHNKYYKTTGCSSFPAFNKYYRRLSENSWIDIRASLHPKNNTRSTITTFEIAECDYVIADYGSTVYEAWALGIPVIFPSWLTGNNIIKQLLGSAEAYIYNNRIGIHCNSYRDMLARICLEPRPGSEKIGKKVRNFMKQYMPSRYNGNSGLTIAKLAIRLSKQKQILPNAVETLDIASNADANTTINADADTDTHEPQPQPQSQPQPQPQTLPKKKPTSGVKRIVPKRRKIIRPEIKPTQPTASSRTTASRRTTTIRSGKKVIVSIKAANGRIRRIRGRRVQKK